MMNPGEKRLLKNVAKVYAERELLINKMAGSAVSLSQAEAKVNALIGDERLLDLMGVIDGLVLSARGVDKLDEFIDSTIKAEKYHSLMMLSAEELERQLREDAERALTEASSFQTLKMRLQKLSKNYR